MRATWHLRTGRLGDAATAELTDMADAVDQNRGNPPSADAMYRDCTFLTPAYLLESCYQPERAVHTAWPAGPCRLFMRSMGAMASLFSAAA